MKLHELENIGATILKKIVGRGPGSGLGKLVDADIKDKTLSEVEEFLLHLKGTTTSFRRLPKRGFTNANQDSLCSYQCWWFKRIWKWNFSYTRQC